MRARDGGGPCQQYLYRSTHGTSGRKAVLSEHLVVTPQKAARRCAGIVLAFAGCFQSGHGTREGCWSSHRTIAATSTTPRTVQQTALRCSLANLTVRAIGIP